MSCARNLAQLKDAEVASENTEEELACGRSQVLTFDSGRTWRWVVINHFFFVLGVVLCLSVGLWQMGYGTRRPLRRFRR